MYRAPGSSKRVSKVGFDWLEIDDILSKLEEELSELRVALKSNDTEHVRNEIGDLLFTCVNISRFLGYNAEDLLRINIKKFEKRFEFVDKKIKKKKIIFQI